MEFEDGPDSVHLRTVVELISHGRGTPGFRNWTAVRDGLAAIETNERRRNPRQGGLKILTKADMLGETAAELQKRSSAWQKLDAMIGLDEVKKTIRLYFSQIKYEHYRALQGRQPRKPMLNRLFLGPPGTGKTTVARLLAEIFSELGIVSNDAVVIREPSTLIGSYVGHSEEKTRDAFEEALGGVLIIDNAHTFFSGGTHMTRESPDEFRSGIIDTLVGQYHRHEENAAHERVTVFFVGQKDSVVELLETGNPGLGRMLPLNEAFHFPTYSENHLGEILQREIKTAGLTASPEAIATAHGLLSLAKHRPNFANATAVGSLLCTAMSRHQVRVLAMVDVRKALAEPLGPKDFDPDCDRPRLARQRFAKLFSDLQGAEYIMDQFLGYQELVVQLRGRGIDPRPYVPLSFVFKGSPGTGKTTVARKVAQVYYEMGFLSAPEMIECSVAQLVSAGNSSSRGSGVERTFERALGKVLFVDEAYLLRHIGGHGAIGDMVDCMTKERFAGKLVVVLAGYDEDMGQLLQENPGLRSRFATTVSFRRMTPTDAILLLKRLVDKVGIRITGLEPGDPLRQQAVRLLARLAATRTWANGRDVEALARMLIQDTFKASMTQQQNSTDAKAAMAESGDIEVKAMAVVLLLASHLGSAIELDEKNSTVREHEAGRDNRARVGVGRNRR
jgi:SpoVK/Ycf46/Vps4 family AAA+-type ATPase